MLKQVVGKHKKAGYIFVTWIGDHLPKHVHVIKNGIEICKWDLENHQVIEGKSNRKIVKAINDLIKEGKLL